MSFRLIPKSMTLNDLEQRNVLLFCVIFTKFGNLRGVLRKIGWFTFAISSSDELLLTETTRMIGSKNVLMHYQPTDRRKTVEKCVFE